MQPSVEQAILPNIPWTTIQSALNVAFQEDVATWNFDLIEAEGKVTHLNVAPKSQSEKTATPLYLVFASRVPMPSGGTWLVYFIWVPTKLKGNQKLEDASHVILDAVADLYDVAFKIALHWKEQEIDRQLTQAFYEPDFNEPDLSDFDIGDSAFDRTVADNAVGDGVTETGASEGNGNQGNGNQDTDGFTDVIF